MAAASPIHLQYAGTPTNGTSEVQTLTIGGSPTTGTFKVSFNNFVTAAIAWSATNATLLANIQAALRALPNINGAHITTAAVSLTAGIGTISLTFGGNLAVSNQPLMTISYNGLDGSGTLAIATTTAGVDATKRGAGIGATLQDTTTSNVYINGGTVYAPLWSLSAAYNSLGILKVAVGSPALGTATAVKAALGLTAGAQAGITAGITNPDVPRNVSITGNASGIAGNVIVYGTNVNGDVINETIALNGTATVVGNKAFKTVTAVDFPAKTNSSGDTVSIGTGAKLGLPGKLNVGLQPGATLGGTKEGTAPTLATSSTAYESNTATLNSALNGTAVVVYYVYDPA